MMGGLVLGAGAIVLALTAYAAWLWWRVWAQPREREAHNARVLAETEADLARSLSILADSLLTRELNLSEGAIRIKVLLDHWYAPAAGQDDFPAIYSLYLSTCTMPRGAERDAYPRRAIRRLDRERELLEMAAYENVMEEAARLRDKFGVPEGREGLMVDPPASTA